MVKEWHAPPLSSEAGGPHSFKLAQVVKQAIDAANTEAVRTYSLDEASFGAYGGLYVPELLVQPLKDLWTAYQAAQDDPAFTALLA